MTRAIIVGCEGQDGQILWEQLSSRGFALVGVGRRSVRAHLTDWADPIDVGDAASVQRLVGDFRPEQIYYLAAHHYSSQDVAALDACLWEASWGVHVTGFLHFLRAVREVQSTTRIFYASSSRVFGKPSGERQNEQTCLRPDCIYGVTKYTGMMLAEYYRRAFGVHVSCGILYNHESALRGGQFLSQRVVRGLAAIKAGRLRCLELGSLSARVDWGYAPDYTRAMQLILDYELSGNFVIASGVTHSVRELVEVAAESLELDWKEVVVENTAILQRDPVCLCGDSSKLKNATGWQPRVGFREMITLLVGAALGSRELIC